MHSCSGPSTSRWVYMFVFLFVFTIITHMCLPMPAHPSLCPSTCACLGMPCFPTLGGIKALSLQPRSLLPPWLFGPTFFLPWHVHYPIQLFIFWAFIWWPPACFSVVDIHATHPPMPLPAVACAHLPTCHSTAGTHARELWRHAWVPDDGVRQTSWGQIRGQEPKDGCWWASGGQIS